MVVSPWLRDELAPFWTVVLIVAIVLFVIAVGGAPDAR